MARILAYNSPTEGHVYPAAGILFELARRGHEVHVRTLSSEVERLAGLGLEAAPVDPAIEAIELEDWRERSQVKASLAVIEFAAERAPVEIPDMQRAIAQTRPDALIVDVQTEGAGWVAAASGLPWAIYCPYPPAIPSKDAPPYGLGLAPAGGPLGHLRDRLLHAYGRRTLAPHVAVRNAMRAPLGLPSLERYEEQWLEADRFVALTAEPYEFARSDWPGSLRLVGPGTWEPPADPPPWLAEETRPIVLVTVSTSYQNDEKLIAVALEAFAREDVALVVTTAATDPGQFSAPPNARVERFLPHGPIIERAACVVCHGGQGTTQKALAAGVPLAVVPFCRDQFDVARRVQVAGAGVRLHHKRLSPRRLREAVHEAIGMRAGAERVARSFAGAGGYARAADIVEDLLPGEPGSAAPPAVGSARAAPRTQ